mmetsp:Transcript_22982/g.68333  ORF Transcript_22982/g.68333 Transcript_22982/m.68333 type:complete len:347 (+) Transcript_22982:2016-3056(+)
MDELVERVLAVGPGLAKVNLARLKRQRVAMDVHTLAVGLHGHLLDVWRQLGERLAVGQDGRRAVAEERSVPDAGEANEHWQVVLKRHLVEVVVHVVGAQQEVLHRVEAVLQAQRQDAHSRADRIAAAHPVPETKCVLWVDAEGLDEARVSANGDHMLRNAVLAQVLLQPFANGARVKHRFRCRERLRHDHDQRLLRVKALQRARHVDGVDVCEEAQLSVERLLGRERVGLERGVDKQRAQEGAADANRHDRRQRLAGHARPLAVANLVAEVLDLVEHLPDVRHHILALHHNVLVAASARRDVQHRAVLGAVDVLAAEHRVDLLLQLRCARQVVQQLDGLGIDPLPG